MPNFASTAIALVAKFERPAHVLGEAAPERRCTHIQVPSTMALTVSPFFCFLRSLAFLELLQLLSVVDSRCSFKISTRDFSHHELLPALLLDQWHLRQFGLRLPCKMLAAVPKPFLVRRGSDWLQFFVPRQ